MKTNNGDKMYNATQLQAIQQVEFAAMYAAKGVRMFELTGNDLYCEGNYEELCEQHAKAVSLGVSPDDLPNIGE